MTKGKIGPHAVRPKGRPRLDETPEGRERIEARRRFGRWLQARLIEQGGSSSGLAAAVGVSRQSVDQWLAGDTSPTGERRRKLAETLGVQEIDMP